MHTSVILIGVLTLWVGLVVGRPQPGLGHYFYSYPAPSSHTSVVRDALGNQATAYSYQDGHSSSVAVSRNDVSKHLTYVPVPVAPVLHQVHHAQVVYEEPVIAAAPAYHHHQIPSAYYGGEYYY